MHATMRVTCEETLMMCRAADIFLVIRFVSACHQDREEDQCLHDQMGRFFRDMRVAFYTVTPVPATQAADGAEITWASEPQYDAGTSLSFYS
jgi:hypothetical protein